MDGVGGLYQLPSRPSLNWTRLGYDNKRHHMVHIAFRSSVHFDALVCFRVMFSTVLELLYKNFCSTYGITSL